MESPTYSARWQKHLKEQEDEITTLKAEKAVLVEDKERLDWLEDQCPEWAREDKTWSCFTYSSHVQLSTYPKAGMKENLYCDTVRQAIDKTMKEKRAALKGAE